MNVKVGLWQQQTLKLSMTQELSQAIALLQYSTQELTAFLENKALENPLLTVKGEYRKRKSDKTNWIEQVADHTFSLEEYFLSQINTKKVSQVQIKIIKVLIQNLDESGYLRENLQELSNRINAELEQVEYGLHILQQLEPAGIGARNLQECLLIQLRREVYKNELAEQIITHYFVPFAEKKWKIISKELNISMKEIQDVFDHVQMLNPKPCAEFNNGQTSYIVPDAIIESTNEGLFARLCTDLLPKITLNEQYYNQFVKSEDPQVNRFLQDKFQDYQWIAKGIEQRKETLVRVVTQIIIRQPEFFQKGPQHLRPMTMKELAQELDVHESTISRAVREKYVQTPVGTFPLKFFFTSTIQTVSDESTSSSQVKNAISLLIDKENKQNPYSDQEITDYFKTNKGIVVSRRTVAKYRDQLGIPSSSKRKRFE